jgi:phosphatidylinositol-3-phosphatase
MRSRAIALGPGGISPEGKCRHVTARQIGPQPARAIEGDHLVQAERRIGAFLLIAPNQCNDQHGRGNAGAFCNFDPTGNGTQAGLNPASIILGDQTVQKIVTAMTRTSARTASLAPKFYTHFSLLRTLEGGFNLPCLNHAGDSTTAAMSDLLGEKQ